MPRKVRSDTIINIKLSARDISNIALFLGEFRLHKKVKGEEALALLRRLLNASRKGLDRYHLKWEDFVIKMPKPKLHPNIHSSKLKASDVPTIKSSFKKQCDFIFSFGPEAHYMKKSWDKRLASFNKKYKAKQFDKMTIPEIRTGLLFEHRRAHHVGDGMSKLFLKAMYKLLKEKVK